MRDKNSTILRQRADIGEANRGKALCHLSMAAAQLGCFQFSEEARSRELGWNSAEFSRYAFVVRSS